MARADWTYELPPFVADRRGIEEFSVETVGGTAGGTVAAVLDHEGDVYVAVDRSRVLGRHDLRAVPWENVSAIDADDSRIRLDLTEEALAESLELDPDKGIEGGDGAAARRRVELPAEIPRYADTAAAGPRTRPLLFAVICLGVLGMFVLFGAYLAMEAIGLPLGLVVLALPAALLAVVAALGLRLARDPDEHGDHRPRDGVAEPSPPGPARPPERTVGR